MPPDRTPRKAREAWSPEEEKIFNDLIVDCLRKHLAGIIHADGRLESRKNSIKSHINAFINQKDLK